MDAFDIRVPTSVFPGMPDMQRLAQLVTKDDAAKLDEALRRESGKVNQRGVHGVTLLLVAVALNKPNSTRVLLRAGADPHAHASRESNLGRPAAMALRMQTTPDLFGLMLEEKINLDGGSELETESLLALAVMEEGDQRLRQILATGRANVNLADRVQATPLLRAIRSNQYAKALLLLEAGANPGLGRTNPLVALQRHKWQPGSPNDVLLKRLDDKIRSTGLTEQTPMQPAPVRP
ncbi:MAG: hypothetical protein HY854_06085 [Burkholderiales bacterium]|nr:hypothetical protein [Burkholderiales bacterium]